MPPAVATAVTIPQQSLDAALVGALNKRIEDICSDYNDHSFNHCAHFVSHILKLRLPHAALCTNVGTNAKYATRNNGFCVRVNQVYNSCGNRRHWSDADKNDRCFVVATLKDNVTSEDPLTIGDHPKKHIGIIIDGKIYNYSNTHSMVVAKSLDDFKKHYGHKTILLRSDLPA